MNTADTVKLKTFPRQKQERPAVHNPADTPETTYLSNFVAKILESQQQIEDGQYQVIKTDDLWK